MSPDPLILIVDDLPQNVRLLEAVLSPQGFRVATASSGQEALDALGKEHPDLVLLDILMPGMDGFEVVEALRAEPETKTIPVVILTSKSMTQQDKQRLKGRITYVARKTEFDLSGLAGLLRWASSRRQSSVS